MKVSLLTILTLILLRLAIGWHLFYEGAWKVRHDEWSSKGFLVAARGPGALPSRWLAGDPEVTRDGVKFQTADPSIDLIARFTLPTIPDEDMKAMREQDDPPLHVHKYLPDPINMDWEKYFKQFVKDHLLDEKENGETKKKVQQAFEKSKAETVQWLAMGEEKVMPRPSFVRGSLDAKQKTPDRLKEYQAKLKEIKEIQQLEGRVIGTRGVQPKLDKAMREEETLRKTMLAELDSLTERMKDRLNDALSYDLKRISVKAEKPKDWARIELMNNIVRWGLFGIGLCLLIGFLTRAACIFGILLLAAFYLAAPPPPLGVAEPQAKEHFYVINWNLVEAAGLLVLATTSSGRWLGLDGLFRFLLPWNRRKPQPTADNKGPELAAPGTATPS